MTPNPNRSTDTSSEGWSTETTSVPDVAQTVDGIVDVLDETARELRTSLWTHRAGTGDENPSGEEALEADVQADQRYYDRFSALDGVGTFASEERETVESIGSGGLHVSVDPLDGSSNLTSNNLVGTILGVYDEPLPAAGTHLVAAAFVLYGPNPTMVVARDGQVTEYLLGDDGRLAIKDDVTLPEEPSVFGFGGTWSAWNESFRSFADTVKPLLKQRYSGAMVADVAQVLERGGVFAYPAVASRPDGKLRLQFEGLPMGYIIETAGGLATDGDGPLLSKEPASLHARSPVFLGNESVVSLMDGQ